MRWLFIIATGFSITVGTQAADRSVVVLPNRANDPEIVRSFWASGSEQDQAVALGVCVGLCAHPLTAGLGQSFLPKQEQSRSVAVADEPFQGSLQTSYPALFAGSNPFKPSNFQLPASLNNGAGMGGMPGGANSAQAAANRPATLQTVSPDGTAQPLIHNNATTNVRPSPDSPIAVGTLSEAISTNVIDEPLAVLLPTVTDPSLFGPPISSITVPGYRPGSSNSLSDLVRPEDPEPNWRPTPLTPPPAVPEPSSLLLTLFGGLALGVARRKILRAKSEKSA